MKTLPEHTVEAEVVETPEQIARMIIGLGIDKRDELAEIQKCTKDYGVMLKTLSILFKVRMAKIGVKI